MKKWIDLEKELPKCHDILKVRRGNGNEVKAYYFLYPHPCLKWMKTSPFQDHSTLEFIFDVTHWFKVDD